MDFKLWGIFKWTLSFRCHCHLIEYPTMPLIFSIKCLFITSHLDRRCHISLYLLSFYHILLMHLDHNFIGFIYWIYSHYRITNQRYEIKSTIMFSINYSFFSWAIIGPPAVSIDQNNCHGQGAISMLICCCTLHFFLSPLDKKTIGWLSKSI